MRLLISIRLPAPLLAALNAFLAAQAVRPRPGDVLRVALCEYLAAKGHWPPKPH